jgi:hypothetical protein
MIKNTLTDHLGCPACDKAEKRSVTTMDGWSTLDNLRSDYWISGPGESKLLDVRIGIVKAADTRLLAEHSFFQRFVAESYRIKTASGTEVASLGE